MPKQKTTARRNPLNERNEKVPSTTWQEDCIYTPLHSRPAGRRSTRSGKAKGGEVTASEDEEEIHVVSKKKHRKEETYAPRTLRSAKRRILQEEEKEARATVGKRRGSTYNEKESIGRENLMLGSSESDEPCEDLDESYHDEETEESESSSHYEESPTKQATTTSSRTSKNSNNSSDSEEENLKPTDQPLPTSTDTTATKESGAQSIEPPPPPVESADELVAAKPTTSISTRIGIFSSTDYLTTFNSRRLTEDIVEGYFSGTGPAKSSYMFPEIDPVLIERLSSVKSGAGRQNGLAALKDMYRGLFHYWYCQLESNFNLLFHGLGSKLELLNEFRSAKLTAQHQVVIYGFFPGQSLKGILQEVISDIFELPDKPKTTYDQSKLICSTLCNDSSSSVKSLYFVIHNIDGYPFQDQKVQWSLSLLSACPCVHLIASIDHPRSPLLWDESTAGWFNWAWHHTPTYERYEAERLYGSTPKSKGSDVTSLESFSRVINSLTNNARGIFKLLASYQLDSRDDPAYSGLSFTALYQKCRESFLVNSDVTLRSQLTEFLDHKLVRFKKGQDGAELLLIPLENSLLEQFVNEQLS